MKNRYLAQILIPVITFATIVCSGFGVWIFVNEEKQVSNMIGNVTISSYCELGDISLKSPIQLGYQNYRIVFEQGGDNAISDPNIGVNFVPALVFDFTPVKEGELGDEYLNDLNGYAFKYTLTCQSNNTAFNYYAEFIDNQSDYLDINVNDSTKEFAITPLFKYVDGRKPDTTETFKNMLLELDNAKNEPVNISLNISFVKK